MTPDGTIEPLGRGAVLVVGCGALARELLATLEAGCFRGIDVTCLPAILHNHPERIVPAVQAKIRANRDRYRTIFCLYGDCGTGGELDGMLAAEGVERIAGPHCYSFLAGAAPFDALMEDEPGTFFLTDYLVRHFDRLVWEGLGLDRFPALRDSYFSHYRRVVHLAQTVDPDLAMRAEAAAKRLALRFERRFTGLGGLATALAPLAEVA